MDFGFTRNIGEYYLPNIYPKNKVTGTTDSTGFLNAISAKAAERAESVSFEEMLKSKYPGAYYNVMDTSKIDSGLWGRNDYPWDAYFKEPADDAVLDWKPAGAEPDMQSPQVHARMNSMLGKVAVVIPPELEEKMKNDSELAQKVMDRINNFILTNEASEPGTLKGYVMTFDENGEMNHACVVGEGRITVSSSEFAEARKAREAKHAEYERIAEENALKHKMLQEAIDIDKEKVKWAQYMNPLGAKFYTAEEMAKMQAELIEKNTATLHKLSDPYSIIYKKLHPEYNGERIFCEYPGGPLYTADEIMEVMNRNLKDAKYQAEARK